MVGPMWQIAAVMLGSGVLGGIINFLITDPAQERPLKWWQHVTVGIGAAFMVPLFLNMISSGLIDDIRGANDSPSDPAELFVLAGFCLVAAVSARAFIRTLSNRLLQEVRDAKQTAQDAKEDAAEAQRVVAPLVEQDVTEAEAGTDDQAPKRVASTLSPEELRALSALAHSSFSMRSLTGLARDAQLDKTVVNSVLSNLLAQGLIAQTQSKNGQPRWYLTPLGRQVAPSA